MSIDFDSPVMTFGFGSLAMAGAATVNSKISSNKRPFSGIPFDDMAYAAMVDAPSQIQNKVMDKNNSTAPKLALTLTSGGDSKGETNRSNRELGKNRVDDEYESKSGSDNVEGSRSGDDQEDSQPERKKPYHRHTPQQIQEMEAFFKEYPHPDEKQRQQLSKKLHLAPRQIKFWFQNRRTQMKAQQERHDNATLRGENERLKMENRSIKEAMTNCSCYNCGGPAMLTEMPFEEQQLRLENSRLKNELERVTAITGKLCGRPYSQMLSFSPLHNASLSLTAGGSGVSNLDSLHSTINPTSDFLDGLSPVDVAGRAASPSRIDKSSAAALAVAAMNELFRMARMQHPFWISNPHADGITETLNHEEYLRQFTRVLGPKPLGYRTEANRHAGTVLMNSQNLVEILMSANRYAEMFPSIVSRATTIEVVCSGVGGTRNGELQLMYMELHLLSPLGPVREFYFLRFCQQLGAGIWAIVDVSADSLVENTIPVNCKRQPSGLIIQELPGNFSTVTWVEHIECDDRGVHSLYRPVVSSGLAFGSQRWLSALQHQCERLALLMEINADTSAFPDPRGRQSLLKLVQRMTTDFCTSLSPSMVNNWATLSGDGDEDIRVSTRKNMENPELPGRVVLCAATSVWLPVTPQKSFDFLRDLNRRSQWDMLSTGETKQEMTRIVRGQDRRNSISLLASNGINMDQTAFILQECCTDAWGSIIVYAPFDIASMHTVMQGGESDYVSVLPSGFVILPDGLGGTLTETESSSSSMQKRGSILTVAFQILLANMTTPRPAMEDVQAVQRLISYTVQKIRTALILDDA
eukprot:PITA_29578